MRSATTRGTVYGMTPTQTGTNRNPVVNLGEFPDKPSITQADEAMRLVSDTTGARWMVAKLSGYWVFMKDGSFVAQSRRQFDRALADSCSVTVIRRRPTS